VQGCCDAKPERTKMGQRTIRVRRTSTAQRCQHNTVTDKEHLCHSSAPKAAVREYLVYRWAILEYMQNYEAGQITSLNQ